MWILNDAKNCCSQSAFLALDNQGFARVELERSESSVRIETRTGKSAGREPALVRTIGILSED